MTCQPADFYPRSPCGERPLAPEENPTQKRISIHALLAESDTSIDNLTQGVLFLSTLSLRRATGSGAGSWPHGIFLSTLSLRRATVSPDTSSTQWRLFLSTLSLRRATGLSYFYIIKITISIHALLAESDLIGPPCVTSSNGFLSTLSLRRATNKIRHNKEKPRHFYPRSPCGERPPKMR